MLRKQLGGCSVDKNGLVIDVFKYIEVRRKQDASWYKRFTNETENQQG